MEKNVQNTVIEFNYEIYLSLTVLLSEMEAFPKVVGYQKLVQ